MFLRTFHHISRELNSAISFSLKNQKTSVRSSNGHKNWDFSSLSLFFRQLNSAISLFSKSSKLTFPNRISTNVIWFIWFCKNPNSTAPSMMPQTQGLIETAGVSALFIVRMTDARPWSSPRRAGPGAGGSRAGPRSEARPAWRATTTEEEAWNVVT